MPRLMATLISFALRVQAKVYMRVFFMAPPSWVNEWGKTHVRVLIDEQLCNINLLQGIARHWKLSVRVYARHTRLRTARGSWA